MTTHQNTKAQNTLILQVLLGTQLYCPSTGTRCLDLSQNWVISASAQGVGKWQQAARQSHCSWESKSESRPESCTCCFPCSAHRDYLHQDELPTPLLWAADTCICPAQTASTAPRWPQASAKETDRGESLDLTACHWWTWPMVGKAVLFSIYLPKPICRSDILFLDESRWTDLRKIKQIGLSNVKGSNSLLPPQSRGNHLDGQKQGAASGLF